MKKLLIIVLSFARAAFAADSLPGTKTQIKTGAATDVQVQLSDTGGTTYTGAKTGQLPAALGQTTAAGSVSVVMSSDSKGQAAGTPAFAQLSDGSAGYTGAKTGQLPSALGQTTKSASVSVTLASDQGSLSTTPSAATGAANARAAPVSIASAATTTITCKGSLTVSQPVKLYRVRATGAAMARCIVRYTDNVTSTNYGDIVLSPASPNGEIRFPDGFAGQTAGTTGTQAIELSCTNFDSAAQDFGCDVSYCQAASGC